MCIKVNWYQTSGLLWFCQCQFGSLLLEFSLAPRRRRDALSAHFAARPRRGLWKGLQTLPVLHGLHGLRGKCQWMIYIYMMISVISPAQWIQWQPFSIVGILSAESAEGVLSKLLPSSRASSFIRMSWNGRCRVCNMTSISTGMEKTIEKDSWEWNKMTRNQCLVLGCNLRVQWQSTCPAPSHFRKGPPFALFGDPSLRPQPGCQVCSDSARSTVLKLKFEVQSKLDFETASCKDKLLHFLLTVSTAPSCAWDSCLHFQAFGGHCD